jgi:hypothetical protein
MQFLHLQPYKKQENRYTNTRRRKTFMKLKWKKFTPLMCLSNHTNKVRTISLSPRYPAEPLPPPCSYAPPLYDTLCRYSSSALDWFMARCTSYSSLYSPMGLFPTPAASSRLNLSHARSAVTFLALSKSRWKYCCTSSGTNLQWITDDPLAAKCCLKRVAPPPAFTVLQYLHRNPG